MEVRALLIVMGLVARAHADSPDEAGPIPDPNLRWELQAAPTAGAVEAYGQGHGAFGGHFQAALEHDRAALLGEVELFHLVRTCPRDEDCSGPASSPGNELRLAVAGRYDLVHTRALHRPRGGRARWERLDVWLAAGIGVETISIDELSTRSRPDLGFEGGLTLTNRAGQPFYGLRYQIQLARPFAGASGGRSFVLRRLRDRVRRLGASGARGVEIEALQDRRESGDRGGARRRVLAVEHRLVRGDERRQRVALVVLRSTAR